MGEVQHLDGGIEEEDFGVDVDTAAPSKKDVVLGSTEAGMARYAQTLYDAAHHDVVESANHAADAALSVLDQSIGEA